jgi:hypothetical protein
MADVRPARGAFTVTSSVTFLALEGQTPISWVAMQGVTNSPVVLEGNTTFAAFSFAALPDSLPHNITVGYHDTLTISDGSGGMGTLSIDGTFSGFVNRGTGQIALTNSFDQAHPGPTQAVMVGGTTLFVTPSFFSQPGGFLVTAPTGQLGALVSTVPEPGGLTLLGTGTAGLLLTAWRRRGRRIT